MHASSILRGQSSPLLNRIFGVTFMAVVTLYMSDRDNSKTFADKKEADQYDKMLELAENVSVWVERHIEGLTDKQIESIGMLIAEHKDAMASALKGKPEELLNTSPSDADENVTPIAANS